MDMYKEILSQLLSHYELQVVFPQLEANINKIFELECYKALQDIKAILEDDNNSDAECFMKIEEVINVFDSLGVDTGVRHDFG